jgi:hypothetical protein
MLGRHSMPSCLSPHNRRPMLPPGSRSNRA